MNKILSIIIAGGLCLILGASVSADVTPSNTWTNFYGSASTYNGQPVPPGSIIDAYDEDLVHCGTWIVNNDGHYGFMPVYGDEALTVEDEGAEVGSALTFYINNRLAVPEGPGSAIWAGHGEKIELNLSAAAEVGIEPVTDVTEYTVYPGDTVKITALVKNTGQGVDFYTVSGSTTHSWIFDPMFGFVYALPNEIVTVEFEVYIPLAIFDEVDELVDYKISSGADPAVFVTNQVLLRVRIPTDVNDGDGSILPNSFDLHQNFPNPFNPTTTISFDLVQRADVRLEVFDLLGRAVHETEMDNLTAGSHAVEFDATELSSGIYFYRVSAGDYSDMKKMVLLK